MLLPGDAPTAACTGEGAGMTPPGFSRREVLAGGLSLAGAAFLASCSDTVQRAASVCPAGSDLEAVEHVVFVMQENRSFDHYFGMYPGVRGFNDRDGDARSIFEQRWPDGPDGQTHLFPYKLKDATTQPLCAGNADVPTHDWGPQHQSWNGGKMDRFVEVHTEQGNDGPAQGPLVMGYLTRDEVPLHWALADAFTICDAYHCSVIGPTMPNRLYSLSGTIDPSGSDGGPVVATPGTSDSAAAVGSASWTCMPEVLEDAGVSWKVYQPPGTSAGPNQDTALAVGFNALLYFEQLLQEGSPLYEKAFTPSWPDQFEADVRNGELPQVSWMIPSLADSEHPSAPPGNGEAFVKKVLDTLVSNEDLWSKTVVFITYDENGGFFDHVPPPTPSSGTEGEELTASPLPSGADGEAAPIGLGFRVPAIVASPFSRGGWVNSDLFDHTSQLRFLEERFDVQMPNITRWRRDTVGDLTTTLDFDDKETSVPDLPRTTTDDPDWGDHCPTADDIAPFIESPVALDVPRGGSMPSQESGSAKRRDCEPAS